jgi:hypothetical protein
MPITIIPGLDYAKVYVDRHTWKFDEDGFAQATNAALLQAEQQVQEKIRGIHNDIYNTYAPNDYDVTVGGVPIDKANIEQI